MQRFYDRLPLFVVAIFLILTGGWTIYSVFVEVSPVEMSLYNAWLSKIMSPEDLDAGKQYIDLVRRRHAGEFDATVDGSERRAFSRETFERMASVLTDQRPQEIAVVGFHKSWNSTETDCDVTYQLRYPHWWTLVEVFFRWQDGSPHLLGFHLQRFNQSLQQSNAFFAPGKGMRQLLALFAAVAVWVFSAVTLFVCAGTPVLKRKWLWLIAIAAGVGEYSLNWTSAAYGVTPFFVAVPIAGAISASPYSPWVIFIGFPLGAVVFWVRRWQAATQSVAEALQT